MKLSHQSPLTLSPQLLDTCHFSDLAFLTCSPPFLRGTNWPACLRSRCSSADGLLDVAGREGSRPTVARRLPARDPGPTEPHRSAARRLAPPRSLRVTWLPQRQSEKAIAEESATGKVNCQLIVSIDKYNSPRGCNIFSIVWLNK